MNQLPIIFIVKYLLLVTHVLIAEVGFQSCWVSQSDNPQSRYKYLSLFLLGKNNLLDKALYIAPYIALY